MRLSSKKGLLLRESDLVLSGSCVLCLLVILVLGWVLFFMHVAGVIAPGTSRDSLWLTVAMFEPQS